MKTTRKLLLALVLVMSILMTLAVAVIPASAASTDSNGKTYIYADVSFWDPSSARFAAYFFNNSTNQNTWVNMTKHSGNIYKAEIPAGNWVGVIFCRMNKSTTANNWNNKWNQTGDLTVAKAKSNCYYKVNVWDGANDNQWKDHSNSTSTTAATCTVDGKKVTTCSTCGNKTEETISKLGHDLKDVAGQAATCTAPGYTAYKDCSRCDYIEGKNEIAKLGHDMVTDEAKAPTCTETGLTAGSHCSRCDDATTAQETVDALDHNYGEDGKDATCGVCGHANPNACQHDWVDADCVLPKTCSKCGDTEGEPNGHEVLKHVTAVDATCEAPGNPEYWYCEACGMATTVEGQELNTPVARMVTGATGHDMADATCTAPSTCKNGCGLTVGEPNGHSYIPSVTAPTCTAAGYTTYTCGACGDTYVADEVAELGHDLVDVEGKDATCTEAGYTAYKDCSRCDHIEGKTEIPATGHNHVNNICTVCEHVEYVYIYFQNNWLWSDVKVYYWDANGELNASWPGAALDLFENDGTYDIYLVKIPTDFNATGIIFNGIKNDGSGNRDQTPDITGFVTCNLYSMKWDNGNKVDVKPAHNHTEQVTTPATCTTPGLKTFTCTCGNTYTEDIVINANAHYDGCGHYAVEGDSLQAALGNGSVELTKPVSVTGALTIVSGAVLDLKGQTLTADAIVTFNGAIVDSVGTGKIIVNAGKLEIAEGNYKYAPIHVETVEGKSTYVITPVKVQGVTAELSNTAIVRPSLNGQYTNKELFADEVIAHGISFHLVVTRTNGVVSEKATLGFTEEQIKTLYSDNKHAISINLVGGLEGYTYTVELVVESAGVQVHSTEVAILTVPVTSTTEEEGETTND